MEIFAVVILNPSARIRPVSFEIYRSGLRFSESRIRIHIAVFLRPYDLSTSKKPGCGLAWFWHHGSGSESAIFLRIMDP